MQKLTPKMEGYLETIYDICTREGDARVTDIAVKMNVSKATVNRAVSLLAELGFVAYQKYQTVTMTEAGTSVAKRTGSKHEIIERFMVKILKMDPVTARADACEIEHIISDEAIRAMKNYMR